MCKQITFSRLLKDRRDWLDMSIASILLGLSVASTPVALGQCQPATPCPCAADGMCYPKRETWGMYTTNWRPFPGDSVVPTRADGGPEILQNELPTHIVPTPDKEDLRGPVRPTRPAAPAATPDSIDTGVDGLPPLPQNEAAPAEGEQPAEPAAEEAPGPLDNLDLPGFGPPQGLLQPLPQIEDGPPALPTALSQAIAVSGGSAMQAGFPTGATTTTAPAPTASANHTRTQPKAVASPSQFVTPAAANIELTNPAAKNVQKTMDQDLQQAIYYEASDLDSAMK